MDTQAPIPILLPKLQIPPFRLQLVARQHLIQSLDQGLHRKLTILSAPAGYGKSTLLSEWATGCKWPLGWITLESGDNDIERFIAYLISAMQAAESSLSRLSSILETRFSFQPMPPDAILAILVNQLSLTAERLVLVLDDYHLIDNQEIHGFLNTLLDNLPPNIHLVISTRVDPPIKLARLRAKDQLNEITERELRFTPQEAENFFDIVMGLRLTRAQVTEIEARTEGWITGLQLAGLSLKDRQNPDDLIKTLSGTHRFILDYLAEEVFSDLPAALQTFLLRVSILDRLSPGLCDAVIGDLVGESGVQLQSKIVLDFLDASNLFVIPLDSQRQWYRFHSLFAEFLQDRLESQAADELARLHRQAAIWYAENNLFSEAIRHSLAGGEIDGAADLIQSHAKEYLTRGEIRTLSNWIEALPEGVITARPQLGLARAWGRLMRDPFDFWNTIDQQISQIARGFGIARDGLLGSLAESEPGSEQRSGLAEFAMLQGFAQRDTTDTSETIKLFNAALEYFPENEKILRSFTLAGLASTYARTGMIKRAEENFAQAAQTSQSANSLYGFVACTDWQATMQAEQGQLTRAATTYRQAIDTLSSQSKFPLPLSGHVYVGLASVLLEWNDVPGALENVQRGLKIGDQVRDIDALLKGHVLLAQIYQILGRPEEMHKAIQDADRTALETKSPGCLHEIQAWKAQLVLAAGDVQEAQQWATRRGLGINKPMPLPGDIAEIEQFTYIRLLRTMGKAAETLPILGALINLQEQSGRKQALIESLVLQASCLRALNRIEEAVRTLARTLLLAEPEGFVRIFILEGQPMAALLRTTGTQGHSPDYVKRLLAAFGENLTPQETIIDPLSERELEVLQMIAEGLTNVEIASKMIIAQSTVKTHINRIYRKLDVDTRTQAVVRARQLKILP